MPRGRPRGSSLAAEAKPRGRMTAYAFFVQTCRSEHKKLHPEENVQFAEFSRQCSERWKTMVEAEKKKFHELADKDKIRYNAEMQNFSPVGGATRRGRRPRGMKPPKDPNKPKRALSAFFYYANDERSSVRAANPDFSVGEVAKELGRQWGEMTDAEKMKFEKSAEEDRARYDREMTIYRSGGAVKKIKASNGHPVDATPDVDDDDDDDEVVEEKTNGVEPEGSDEGSDEGSELGSDED